MIISVSQKHSEGSPGPAEKKRDIEENCLLALFQDWGDPFLMVREGEWVFHKGLMGGYGLGGYSPTMATIDSCVSLRQSCPKGTTAVFVQD